MVECLLDKALGLITPCATKNKINNRQPYISFVLQPQGHSLNHKIVLINEYSGIIFSGSFQFCENNSKILFSRRETLKSCKLKSRAKTLYHLLVMQEAVLKSARAHLRSCVSKQYKKDDKGRLLVWTQLVNDLHEP